MLVQFIHIIFLPHNALYFVKGTSPCSQGVPQHGAATAILPGWTQSWGLQAPFFHWACVEELRSLTPSATANCQLAFSWWFWCSGFRTVSSFSSSCYTIHFIVDSDVLLLVLTSIILQDLSLLFWGLLALFAPKYGYRGDIEAISFLSSTTCAPIVLILGHYCLNPWMWDLPASRNCILWE